MAVDTAEKRYSMMNFVGGPGICTVPMFEPDGTVDDDDRFHLLNLYSGIALDPPPVLGNGGIQVAAGSHRRRMRR